MTRKILILTVLANWLSVCQICAQPTYSPSAEPTTVPASHYKIITYVGFNSSSIQAYPSKASSTTLKSPYHMWSDADGNIYFADMNSNRVRKVNLDTSIVSVIAGSATGTPGATGDGGQATSALFYNPTGVFIDSVNQMFVADKLNKVIRLVDLSSGIVTLYAGTYGSGVTTRGDGGPASSAAVYNPYGVWADTAGNLYTTEAYAHKVRKITPLTKIITTFAGMGSPSGDTGNGGMATSAYFSQPIGLFGDSTNSHIIIADYGNGVVRRVHLGTGIVTRFAGINGSKGYSGDGGRATMAQFSEPAGVWGDSLGNVYVTDHNQVLRRVAAISSVVNTIAGTGVLTGSGADNGDGGPATSATLGTPQGVYGDSVGNIYLAEYARHRIRKLIAESPSIAPTTAPTTPTTTPSRVPSAVPSASRSPTASPTRGPSAVPSRSPSATPIISPTHTPSATPSAILSVSPTRAPSNAPSRSPSSVPSRMPSILPTVLPSMAPTAFTTSVAPTTRAPSITPTVSIAPTSFSRITIVTVLGTGTTSSTGDGGRGTAATVSGPYGVVVDTVGHLYTSEYNGHKIRKVSSLTGLVSTAVGTGNNGYNGDNNVATSTALYSPVGLSIASNNVMIFADSLNKLIRRADLNTGIVVTIAGTFASTTSSGDGGPATSATIIKPRGLWADTVGNVYISEYDGHRVRKISAVDRTISAVAGTGNAGNLGEGGAASSAKINCAVGLFGDSSNKFLYFADLQNYAVRRVDLATGTVSTFAGTLGVYQENDSRDDVAATSINLAKPTGVYGDTAGNIFICDSASKVRMVSATGRVTTVAGYGVSGNTPLSGNGDFGLAIEAKFYNNFFLVVDRAGTIFVSDYSNHKVRMIYNTTFTGSPVLAPTYLPTLAITTPTETPTVASNYYIRTLIGTGATSPVRENVRATSTALALPYGVVTDSAGDVIVSEFYGHRIRKMNRQSTIIVTIAGNSQTNYTGDGGFATSASMYHPTGIFLSSTGNLFISEHMSKVIRIVDLGSNIITTFAGTFQVTAPSGDGGPATSAALIAPRGLWGDTAGNLFIADADAFRIRKISFETMKVSTFVGSGVSGGGGDGGPATDAQLWGCLGIWGDSNNQYLYLADGKTFVVRRVNLSGGIVSLFAGSYGLQSRFGVDNVPATSAVLFAPAVAVGDTLGNLFISDTGNKVRKIGRLNRKIVTIAGTGNSSSVATARNGDDGLASAALISNARMIFVETTGDIVLAEYQQHKVRFIFNVEQETYTPTTLPTTRAPTRTPTILPTISSKPTSLTGLISRTLIGTGAGTSSGDGGPASSANVNGPYAIVGDSFGNLYTTEFNGHRVRKYNAGMDIITRFVGGGGVGSGGDGGVSSSAKLNYPCMLFLDSSNAQLYISLDGDYTVRRVDLTTSIITTFAGVSRNSTSSGDGKVATSASFSSLRGIWGDSGGNFYLAEIFGYKIRKIDTNNIVSTLAGVGLIGFGGDGGPATSAKLWWPVGLWSDSSAKQLYIGDDFNYVVRSIDLATNIIRTFAGTIAVKNTVANVDNIAATSSTFGNVLCVWGDTLANVYITDPNPKIRKVDGRTGIITTHAGNSSNGDNIGPVPALSALYDLPKGLFVDAAGTVYLADGGNHKFRMIYNTSHTASPVTSPSLAPTSPTFAPTRLPSGPPSAAPSPYPSVTLVRTFAGTGGSPSCCDGGPATLARMASVYGVWGTPSGVIYFSDQSGHKIRKVTEEGIILGVTSPAGAGVSGDSGAVSSALVNTPRMIHIDTVRNLLYFVDSGNYAVRAIDLGTNIITRLTSTSGATSTSIVTQAVSSATFSTAVAGVWSDTAGNLFISDHCIRRVSRATQIIVTIAGNGVGTNSGDGGAATSATMSFPVGLFGDTNNQFLYAAQYSSHVLRQLNLVSGIISTFAGISGSSGNAAEGMHATAGLISYPIGVWGDGQGANLFVAEGAKIRKISLGVSGGNLMFTYAGTGVDAANSTMPNGDGGPATSAQFKTVRGLYGDSTNALYLADLSNKRIRYIYSRELLPSQSPTRTPTFGTTLLITTIAGTGNSSTAVNNGNKATSARLVFPYGVVSDSAGHVYVSEFTGMRIRKVTAGSNIISTVVGTGMSDHTGDNGAASSATVDYPSMLFLDSVGRLYWAEKESLAVRVVDLNSGIVSKFAGTYMVSVPSGDGGKATAAAFKSPRGVWADSLGSVFVSDLTGYTVRKIAPNTMIITTFAGTGGLGISGDNGRATAAAMSGPIGLFGDSAGRHLYIVESRKYAIRRVDLATSIITTFAGKLDERREINNDGVAASSACFAFPVSVWGDEQNNVFVTDAETHTLMKISADSAIVATLAGTGNASASATDANGDGGPATLASLSEPHMVFVETTGALLVADYRNNKVRRLFLAQDTFSPSAAPTNTPAPTALPSCIPTVVLSRPPTTVPSICPSKLPTMMPTTVSPSQSPSVAPTKSPSSNPSTAPSIAPSMSPSASPSISPTRSPTQQPSLLPTFHPSRQPTVFPSPQPTLQPTQSLTLLPSAQPSAVRATVYLTTILGTGVATSTGDGGRGTAATVSGPYGVVVDTVGHVYTSEFAAFKVRKLNGLTGLVSTIAGTGHCCISGDGLQATSASIAYPNMMFLDSANKLYFSESGTNNAVRVMDLVSEIISKFVGSFQSTDSSGDGGAATAATLLKCRGLWGDSIGNVYISELDGWRIRRVSAPSAGSIISTFAGTGSPGTTGDGGAASAAKVEGPLGLWGDTNNEYLYYADNRKFSIRRVQLSNGIITTFLGKSGSSGSNGFSEVPPTSARFLGPTGIWGDSIGENFYVSDNGDRVRRYSYSTNLVGVLAGVGRSSNSSTPTAANGDEGPATAAQLYEPRQLCVNSEGAVLIADFANNKVRMTYTSAPSATPTVTPTSVAPTIMLTASPSMAPSRVPSTTPSFSPSVVPSIAPSVQPTASPSLCPSATPSASPTHTPTSTPTVLSTLVPTKHPSTLPSTLPNAVPSEVPTTIPTLIPTLSPTNLPIAVPSSHKPSISPSHFSTYTPTWCPSATPFDSETPSHAPTLVPSLSPTMLPSVVSSSFAPSVTPGDQPSTVPTASPSTQPSLIPTVIPSVIPSAVLSEGPSALPTHAPSCMPSKLPSAEPSHGISDTPAAAPSIKPSKPSTLQPSHAPSTPPSSEHPSAVPSAPPSTSQTMNPTPSPSIETHAPTCNPSASPSRLPTMSPSDAPTAGSSTGPPTSQPSSQPSCRPSTLPSGQPSNQPTSQPSSQPSLLPSGQPSSHPSSQPTTQPSNQPTTSPNDQSSGQPSNQPSRQPQPSTQPRASPSAQPSAQPSGRPSHTSRPSVEHSLFNTGSLPGNRSLSVIVGSGLNAAQFKIVLPFLNTVAVAGDGFSDVVVPLPTSGESVVVLGSRNTRDIANNNVYVVSPSFSYDYSGRSVANAGDINGDGYDDLIIGVPYAARCYVLFGARHQGFVNMTDGFTIYGQPFDLTGWSVSGAGDVNNDTFADIIVGAPNAGVNHTSGVSYVLFGKEIGFKDVHLWNLSAADGFAVHGAVAQDCSGLSVSGAGDVNGDGIGDIVIGALNKNTFFSGSAYVIYGRSQATIASISAGSAAISLGAPLSPSQGFTVTGGSWSWFGYSVAAAGDVNGDGFDDIIVGSVPLRTVRSTEISYVIFGGKSVGNLIVGSGVVAAARGVALLGGGAVVSGAGDLNSDGFADVVLSSDFGFTNGAGIVFSFVATLPKAKTTSPSLLPTQPPMSSPTILPSTQAPSSGAPTLVPSTRPSQPSLAPSPRPSDPSSTPSVSPSSPTSAPSSSAPSSLSPTEQPSDTPSIEPTTSAPSTEWPSAEPTLAPTTSPSTLRPTSSRPTKFPRIKPTPAPSIETTSATERMNLTITAGGEYHKTTRGSIHYVVNSTDTVVIRNMLPVDESSPFTSAGDIYTVYANPHSLLVISRFNNHTDRIDLRSGFSQFNRISDLRITQGSVVIALTAGQVIRIGNLHPGDISENNFVFAAASGDESVDVSELEKEVNKQFGLIVGICGFFFVFLLCACYSMAPSWGNSLKNQLLADDLLARGLKSPVVELPQDYYRPEKQNSGGSAVSGVSGASDGQSSMRDRSEADTSSSDDHERNSGDCSISSCSSNGVSSPSSECSFGGEVDITGEQQQENGENREEFGRHGSLLKNTKGSNSRNNNSNDNNNKRNMNSSSYDYDVSKSTIVVGMESVSGGRHSNSNRHSSHHIGNNPPILVPRRNSGNTSRQRSSVTRTRAATSSFSIAEEEDNGISGHLGARRSSCADEDLASVADSSVHSRDNRERSESFLATTATSDDNCYYYSLAEDAEGGPDSHHPVIQYFSSAEQIGARSRSHSRSRAHSRVRGHTYSDISDISGLSHDSYEV